MRITGYLIAGILGLAAGWLVFSGGDKGQSPNETPKTPTQPSPALTPTPTPDRTWHNVPVTPYGYQPPAPPTAQYHFRPLSKREEARLQPGSPAREDLPPPGFSYPSSPGPYPPSPWASPGYDYRREPAFP